MYLPNSGQRMLGSCARRCTELAQLQHRGEMSREKGSSVAVSPLALCRVAASTKNMLCSVAWTVHGDDIFVASPRESIAKMGATLKKRWDPSLMIRRNSAFSLVRCDGARMGWQIEWTMTGHSRTTTSRRKELCTRRCVCVVKCS